MTDEQAWNAAAAGLLEPYDYMHLVKRPRVKRRASIGRLITAAKKAGVTSITLPDGTVMHFGASDERNEWDEVLHHGPH